MKFLVIGCGSIGERHLKNLIDLSCDVSVCDTSKNILTKIKKQYGIQVFSNVNNALKNNFDGVVISTPSNMHMKIAKNAAEKENNLFIEKPVSYTLKGVDELIKTTEKKNLVNLVGCNMRFHSCIRLLKEIVEKNTIGRILCAGLEYGHYILNWSRNYKTADDVFLNAVHELDYIRWLLGDIKSIFCKSDKLSGLKISKDAAEMILKLDSGTLAEIHIDYLQRTKRRACKLIGEKGTVLWESKGKKPENAAVMLFSEKKEETLFDNEIDLNKMYVEEIKHFINCIKGKEKPMQTIRDAKKILEVSLAAKESSKTGKEIILNVD